VERIEGLLLWNVPNVCCSSIMQPSLERPTKQAYRSVQSLGVYAGALPQSLQQRTLDFIQRQMDRELALDLDATNSMRARGESDSRGHLRPRF